MFILEININGQNTGASRVRQSNSTTSNNQAGDVHNTSSSVDAFRCGAEFVTKEGNGIPSSKVSFGVISGSFICVRRNFSTSSWSLNRTDTLQKDSITGFTSDDVEISLESKKGEDVVNVNVLKKEISGEIIVTVRGKKLVLSITNGKIVLKPNPNLIVLSEAPAVVTPKSVPAPTKPDHKSQDVSSTQVLTEIEKYKQELTTQVKKDFSDKEITLTDQDLKKVREKIKADLDLTVSRLKKDLSIEGLSKEIDRLKNLRKEKSNSVIRYSTGEYRPTGQRKISDAELSGLDDLIAFMEKAVNEEVKQPVVITEPPAFETIPTPAPLEPNVDLKRLPPEPPKAMDVLPIPEKKTADLKIEPIILSDISMPSLSSEVMLPEIVEPVLEIPKKSAPVADILPIDPIELPTPLTMEMESSVTLKRVPPELPKTTDMSLPLESKMPDIKLEPIILNTDISMPSLSSEVVLPEIVEPVLEIPKKSAPITDILPIDPIKLSNPLEDSVRSLLDLGLAFKRRFLDLPRTKDSNLDIPVRPKVDVKLSPPKTNDPSISQNPSVELVLPEINEPTFEPIKKRAPLPESLGGELSPTAFDAPSKALGRLQLPERKFERTEVERTPLKLPPLPASNLKDISIPSLSGKVELDISLDPGAVDISPLKRPPMPLEIEDGFSVGAFRLVGNEKMMLDDFLTKLDIEVKAPNISKPKLIGDSSILEEGIKSYRDFLDSENVKYGRDNLWTLEEQDLRDANKIIIEKLDEVSSQITKEISTEGLQKQVEALLALKNSILSRKIRGAIVGGKLPVRTMSDSELKGLDDLIVTFNQTRDTLEKSKDSIDVKEAVSIASSKLQGTLTLFEGRGVSQGFIEPAKIKMALNDLQMTSASLKDKGFKTEGLDSLELQLKTLDSRTELLLSLGVNGGLDNSYEIGGRKIVIVDSSSKTFAAMIPKQAGDQLLISGDGKNWDIPRFDEIVSLGKTLSVATGTSLDSTESFIVKIPEIVKDVKLIENIKFDMRNSSEFSLLSSSKEVDESWTFETNGNLIAHTRKQLHSIGGVSSFAETIGDNYSLTTYDESGAVISKVEDQYDGEALALRKEYGVLGVLVSEKSYVEENGEFKVTEKLFNSAGDTEKSIVEKFENNKLISRVTLTHLKNKLLEESWIDGKHVEVFTDRAIITVDGKALEVSKASRKYIDDVKYEQHDFKRDELGWIVESTDVKYKNEKLESGKDSSSVDEKTVTTFGNVVNNTELRTFFPKSRRVYNSEGVLLKEETFYPGTETVKSTIDYVALRADSYNLEGVKTSKDLKSDKSSFYVKTIDGKAYFNATDIEQLAFNIESKKELDDLENQMKEAGVMTKELAIGIQTHRDLLDSISKEAKRLEDKYGAGGEKLKIIFNKSGEVGGGYNYTTPSPTVMLERLKLLEAELAPYYKADNKFFYNSPKKLQIVLAETLDRRGINSQVGGVQSDETIVLEGPEYRHEAIHEIHHHIADGKEYKEVPVAFGGKERYDSIVSDYKERKKELDDKKKQFRKDEPVIIYEKRVAERMRTNAKRDDKPMELTELEKSFQVYGFPEDYAFNSPAELVAVFAELLFKGGEMPDTEHTRAVLDVTLKPYIDRSGTMNKDYFGITLDDGMIKFPGLFNK